MRRIVNVTNVSLDGVMERMEDWHFDYASDPDMEEVNWESLSWCDTLLIGRRTYDGFAAVWPSETGRVADRLNSMRKVLVSGSTTDPAWQNTTVVSGDLPKILTELKNGPGEGIITYGFGPIVRTLIEQGLLDEMHILVNPVLAGQGDLAEMLIREGAVARFELTGTRPLTSGVAVLSYRPV